MPETLENPVIKEADADKAELRRLVEQADELPFDAEPSSAQPESATRTAEGEPAVEQEKVTPNAEALSEPARDELGRFTKADGTKSEPNEAVPKKDPVLHTAPQQDSAFEKAKKEQERQKGVLANFQRDKEQFEAYRKTEEQRIAQERAKLQRQGQEPDDFTSAQYDWHAKDFERKAELAKNGGDIETAAENYDLAAKARVAADQKRQIEHNQKTEEAKSAFETTWKQNMEATIRELPDLATPDTPLAKQVVELFKTDPVFNYIPDGFKKAATIAGWKMGSERASALENENQTLKARNAELEKLLSPLGGSPTERAGAIPFDRMTHDQQKETLREMAYRADGQAA